MAKVQLAGDYTCYCYPEFQKFRLIILQLK